MGTVIPFNPRSNPRSNRRSNRRSKRASLKEKARGKTLCRSGHHKWAIDQTKQFDVKRGRLVTIRRCTRCDATQTRLD